jgi:GGDEF domain-containing protein
VHDARVGQLKISGVLSSEPAGKPLRDCGRGECFVTYDAGEEDEETRRRHGVIGLRRFKLLRIATEAHDQGIDLTQEGLAKILCAGLKTVKRDIAYFRKHGIFLPTRGQQKDLGPIAPHQVEAVRMTLDGLSDWDVSRRILHSPGMVTRILGAFARVVGLLRQQRDTEEVAYLVGVPRRLVVDYSRLAAEAAADPQRAERLERILTLGGQTDSAPDTLRESGDGARELPTRRRPAIFDDQVKVLRRDAFEYLLDYEVRKATRYKLPLGVVTIEPVGRDQFAQSSRALAGVTLAETLRAALRVTDLIGRATVSRYHVLLPLGDTATTRRVLDRLVGYRGPGEAIWLVAGGACFPAHGPRAADLLRRSEEALSAARERPDQWAVATEGPTSSGGSGAMRDGAATRTDLAKLGGAVPGE